MGIYSFPIFLEFGYSISPENIKFSGIFIFAISFNMPCISALAATARETHSVKWRAKIGVFYTAAALLFSCIVYHIGLLVFFLRKIMLDILK